MIFKIKHILQKSAIVTKLYNSTKSLKINLNKNSPVSISKKTVKKYNRTRTPFVIKSICNAPFTSLLIGIDGKYRVCCYNEEFVLGDIENNTIAEAWFGNRIKILRDKVKNYDFNAGCYLCKIQLQQGAFQTILAKNYDEFKNIKKKYPQLIEFEVSNRCNLECIMCSEKYSSKIAQHNHEKDINNFNIDEDCFLNEFVEFIPHLKKTKFTGGEPFLIKIYYKIWESITKNNPKCDITIQTNGTILNNEIKTILKSGKFNLIISVDSLIKENFEHIRKNGNFEQFYENLLWFIDFCKKEDRFIGITTCLMRQNWHEIPEIIKFCNEKEIILTFNKVYKPPYCSIWGSSSDYINNVACFFKNINLPTNNYIEHSNYMVLNDIKNLVYQWLKEAKENEAFLDEYSKFNTDELEGIFYDKIKNSSNDYNTLVNNNSILQIIQRNLLKYKDSQQYKDLLLELIKIPAEILIREIANNDEKQLQHQLENYLNKTIF